MTPFKEYDAGVMAFATGDTIGCEAHVKLLLHLSRRKGRLYWLIRDRFGGSCVALRVIVNGTSYVASVWAAETIVKRAMSKTHHEENKLII